MRGTRLLWRLFTSYLWVTVFALLIITFYATRVVRDMYLAHMAEDLRARALLLNQQLPQVLEDRAAVDALCKSLGKRVRTRFTVILPDGLVIGDTEKDPATMENHATPERREILSAISSGVGQSTRFSETLQMDQMYVAVATHKEGVPQAVVRASVPVKALNEALAVVQNQILLAGVLAAALIAAVSLVLARRISRPLEDMKQGAERLARGELDHRFGEADLTELQAVADAMNRMAELLDTRIRGMIRQQNELEAVLSSMVEGVLAVDESGRIINMNRAGCQLLELEPARLKNRMIHEMVRKSEFLRFVDSSLASNIPVEGDIEIHSRNQESRFLKAQGAPLYDSQRRKIGALVVFQDTTRLQRLESVRRDFVANVSHELRTPITSIKGFVETLLDGALAERADAERFLRIVLKQTDRLGAIIEDLLLLSRIERQSEEEAVELTSGPLRPVLQAAMDMCNGKAREKPVTLSLECDGDLSASMNASLLEQAVVNLLDNAIKYSGNDGTVWLSAVCEDEWLAIRVRDQGCGIEPQHLTRLFERFYRVDKARSRELGGTGLGLSIVKHIVLAHHGNVEVQSMPSRGTTFTIRLPALFG